MNEDNDTSDLEDAKIMAKFSNLLNKYQSQGKAAHTTVVSARTIPTTNEILPKAQLDDIPTLTEAVILHPSVIQPQPKRRKTIRQVLDAALDDAHIQMDVLDRQALAHALEVRLADQMK